MQLIKPIHPPRFSPLFNFVVVYLLQFVSCSSHVFQPTLECKVANITNTTAVAPPVPGDLHVFKEPPTHTLGASCHLQESCTRVATKQVFYAVAMLYVDIHHQN